MWMFHSEQDKQKLDSVTKLCFLKGLQMFSVALSQMDTCKKSISKKPDMFHLACQVRTTSNPFPVQAKFTVPAWARAADFPEHSKKEKKNTLLFLFSSPSAVVAFDEIKSPKLLKRFHCQNPHVSHCHNSDIPKMLLEEIYFFSFFNSLLCQILSLFKVFAFLSSYVGNNSSPKSSWLHPGSDTRAILRLSCFLSHLIQYTVEFPIEWGWECWVCNKSFFFNWLISKHLHYLYLKYLLITN